MYVELDLDLGCIIFIADTKVPVADDRALQGTHPVAQRLLWPNPNALVSPAQHYFARSLAGTPH